MVKKKIGKAALAATLVAGVGLAVAIPALANVRTASPAGVVSMTLPATGQLQARGASAILVLDVLCPDNTSWARVDLKLTQRVSKSTTSAYRYDYIDCTGETQQVPMYMTVDAPGQAFKGGLVSAEASLNGYVPNVGYVQATDSGEVKLRK